MASMLVSSIGTTAGTTAAASSRQWISQRLVTSAESCYNGCSSSSSLPISPATHVAPWLTVGGRRHFHNASNNNDLNNKIRSFFLYNGNNKQHYYGAPCNIQQLRERVRLWKKNIARYYARHVMDAFIASAAARATVARMERAIEKPSDWRDWKRKDWTDELRQEIGLTKWDRFWSATRRLVSLTVLAAPFAVLVPLSAVSQTAQEISWEYALWSIQKAGPTFIKLVQWATTRQDLFSPEFCIYFGRLRDETAGHSWEETCQLLEQELGIPLALATTTPATSTTTTTAAAAAASSDERPILQLESTPIGSGCIAQVYRGKLTRPAGQYPAGSEVAVKVQHPGIWNKVCVDFYILGKVARWLEELPYLNLEYLSLADTVRQFRDIMLPQLDLTLEARHLKRFNRDFGNDDRVSFPHPIEDLTSTRVLTETFIRGTPIMEYVQNNDASISPEERKELAHLGLSTTLKMIFLHDFLHGDLHPGNILVSKSETTGQFRLHLLDCGLVVEMGPEQHVNVVKILGAFTRRNGRLAAQLMVDASSKVQASDLEVELFLQGIEQLVITDQHQNFVENVGDYITDICYMACTRRVKLEASFINAALAVEIMEGIAAQLCPDIAVIPVALPLVLKAEMMHSLPKFHLW